jgi:hypothetical protein
MTAPSTGNMADWQAFADQTAEQQVTTVLDTLRAVVDEYGPEHVYVGGPRNGNQSEGACWYVTSDGLAPDCIAAHVLTRLGMPLAFLARNEQTGADEVCRAFGGVMAPARQVLSAAQLQQDEKRPWSVALSTARLIAERLRREGML